MATFANVGETLELLTADRGETIGVVVGSSDTYEMDIDLQVELGSFGSGAWQTIKTFDTEDADDTFDYITRGVNENIRLFLRRDGGGSCTVTLTETTDLIKKTVTDGRGNVLWNFRQSGVEQTAGFRRTSGTIVTTSAATLTLSPELHAGRIVVTALAATMTVTLPLATGTGDIYTLYTSILITGDHIYQAAGSDVFNGVVGVSFDIAGVMEAAQPTDSTITMNQTTSGGLVGSCIVFTDVADAVWWVSGAVVTTAGETTIFS